MAYRPVSQCCRTLWVWRVCLFRICVFPFFYLDLEGLNFRQWASQNREQWILAYLLGDFLAGHTLKVRKPTAWRVQSWDTAVRMSFALTGVNKICTFYSPFFPFLPFDFLFFWMKEVAYKKNYYWKSYFKTSRFKVMSCKATFTSDLAPWPPVLDYLI